MAEILGTVTDGTGAVLPNALVTIKHLGTGMERSMRTNEVGNYAFTLLPLGGYSVTIAAGGFKTFVAPALTLAAGDRARVNATMEIGEVTQTIEVQAQAAAAVQTDSSTVGALITTQAVQNLPLSGRNVTMLIRLAPGAAEGPVSSLSGGGRPDDRRQTSTVSVYGQTDVVNNVLIDGMDNNQRIIGTIGVKPSVDALQEVKLQTNLYSADTGRTGGAVINMITKSGTNSFHGTLFEFLRNDKLSAKDFFNMPQAGNPLAGVKPKYRQNQFGGSLGGPIQPNKTFFFGDYEGLRIIQGRTGRAIIPTACQLGGASCNGVRQLGNFAELLPGTLLYDITQSPPTPFPNNLIPLSRINRISEKYAALVPRMSPVAGASVVEFFNSPRRTQRQDTFDARIDRQFTQRDYFFGRYSFNQVTTFTPGILPPVEIDGLLVQPSGNTGGAIGGDFFPGTAYQRAQHLGLSYTHLLRPTLVLQLTTSVLRSKINSESINQGKNVNTAFGGPPVNVNAETTGLAVASFAEGGYGGIGDAIFLPTRYWDTSYQYAGSTSWIKSSHNIKFGGSLIRRQVNMYQSSQPKGAFTFSTRQTDSRAGGSGAAGGNAWASFLTGVPFTQARNLIMRSPQFRLWEIGAYVQDDWRATRWLTVNLGLRYDNYTPISEKHNKISNFDPTNPAMLAGGRVLAAGDGGLNKYGGLTRQHNLIAPRLGLAATVLPGFVLRGGFGMSYFPNQVGSGSYFNNQPFVNVLDLRTPLGQPGIAFPQFGQALPAPTPSSTCLTAACGATSTTTVANPTATDFKATKLYQYNFMVEKEIAGNILTIGYVGSKGRNLNRRTTNINQPVPPLGPGGCGETAVITLPHRCQPYFSAIPLVTSINLQMSNGISSYDGLQFVFQRRFNRGLAFSTNYTWAHALSDTGTPVGGFTGQNLWMGNWKYDYGNAADLDVRHRWVLGANYEVPFGKSLTGFAKKAVSGWQVNAIALWSSGLPFTVTNGRNPQSNVGVAADRPNRLQVRAGFKRSIEEWFDTTAFALQPWGTAGNQSANQFFAPPLRKLDLSVFKDFAITESAKLQFRVESFNLTNTPTFAMPTAAISGWTSTDHATARPTRAGNFGRITTTSVFYTPRDIQFALKLIF